jgi:hypothetical protein
VSSSNWMMNTVIMGPGLGFCLVGGKLGSAHRLVAGVL